MKFLDKLHVESNGVPIYLQIRDQILAAIGAGVLKPGERMPTMREVAVTLKIDLNTVRHAYDVTQESGAIVLVKARGTFVADHPPAMTDDDSREKLDRLAYQAVATAAAAGVDAVKLAERIAQIATSSNNNGEVSQ